MCIVAIVWWLVENIVIKTYNKSMNIILSILGFGGLLMGVFNLVHNEILPSVGYMTTCISSCIYWYAW